jgi:cysteine synthase B
MLFEGILDTIGRTPLVELPACSPSPDVRLFAKLEGQNPSGSVKDRIVLQMVRSAEREGRLRPGDTIAVASTGNTGIALAMVGRARGYNVHVVIPQNIYAGILPALAAFGATMEWVPADLGMRQAIVRAQELGAREGWTVLEQFSNADNVRAHYEGTGPEILADLPGVDAFVAGLGTGGTLMGVGRRLKEANAAARVIAVEPHPGSQLQGLKSLADGFVPPILDLDMLDGKILVRGHHALRATAEVMRREGIFAGISSGAVLHAALRVAQRVGAGNYVLLFADGGWKYLASGLWTEPPEEGEEGDLDDTIWW